MSAPANTAATIRELVEDDLTRGFLETLDELASTRLSPPAAREILNRRRQAGARTFVAIVDDRVVGTASLLLEPKFIHGGALCGHIEDVAVHAAFKQRGIGAALVDHATAEARAAGCYKAILNCFDRLAGFYERQGYRRQDVGMRIDLTAPASLPVDFATGLLAVPVAPKS